MHGLRLIVCLLAIAALVAACGGAGGSDGAATTTTAEAAGTYDALAQRVSTLQEKATGYVTTLEDCIAAASGNLARLGCAATALGGIVGEWASVSAALDQLAGSVGGDCKARLADAKAQAGLLGGSVAPPTSVADAEALATKVASTISSFSQAISDAKQACTG